MSQHQPNAADDHPDPDRLADRYLDGVIRALVDEHYPENELRIEHLLDCIESGAPVNEALLRDPVRSASTAFEALRGRRRAGIDGVVGRAGYRMCLEPAGRAGLVAEHVFRQGVGHGGHGQAGNRGHGQDEFADHCSASPFLLTQCNRNSARRNITISGEMPILWLPLISVTRAMEKGARKAVALPESA